MYATKQAILARQRGLQAADALLGLALGLLELREPLQLGFHGPGAVALALELVLEVQDLPLQGEGEGLLLAAVLQLLHELRHVPEEPVAGGVEDLVHVQGRRGFGRERRLVPGGQVLQRGHDVGELPGPPPVLLEDLALGRADQGRPGEALQLRHVLRSEAARNLSVDVDPEFHGSLPADSSMSRLTLMMNSRSSWRSMVTSEPVCS